MEEETGQEKGCKGTTNLPSSWCFLRPHVCMGVWVMMYHLYFKGYLVMTDSLEECKKKQKRLLQALDATSDIVPAMQLKQGELKL